MQTKIMILICSALLVLMSACKKDEDKKTSKADLLTDGRWLRTSYTITPPFDLDGDGVDDADGMAVLPTCWKDDLFIFQRDGTLVIDEGGTRCNPGDPQTETTTWAFLNNETEITIDGDRATIHELTSSRFRITVMLGNSQGDITFIKQ